MWIQYCKEQETHQEMR